MATAPDGVEIKQSIIPGAGLGAFATKSFAKRSRFGPYEGDIITNNKKAHESGYSWLVSVKYFT